MSDAEIKEILETIYGDAIPEGAASLIREMRKRLTMFGPYEPTRKDVVICAIMYDLYLKSTKSAKRGRAAKEEGAKEEVNG